MTLNEMIEKLNRPYELMLEESDAIVAALKAGQAMRDADDKVAFCEAMVEWDAATAKGEDK